MLRILKEGAKVFIISLILAVTFFILFIKSNSPYYLIATAVFLFLFFYTFFFLRIPKREIIQDDDIIYASADGKILSIEENIEAPLFMDGKVHRVVIFMHVANVHWNLAPINGEVSLCEYKKGKLKAAFSPESWKENEHQMIGIENKEKNLKVLVYMVAGLVARRIRFFKKETDLLKQGDIMGLIKYGSANVLYVPASSTLLVKEKQKTKAGKTIIASMQRSQKNAS